MVFGVTVEDRGVQTQHRVTLTSATWQRLTGGGTEPQECVRAAFRFLLEREQPSEILPSFDLNVIKMYFPNFERDFPEYLQPGAER
ncbi:MAG: hypothetical protein IT495_08835 [Gammaproteobacteria bacterium]|nr:hypothetical protein [Gammaproteobacteria bacterium]